jgi:3-oxoacid CoA-transferase B subunit
MKMRLDEQALALRVAKEFQDGMIINLGFGIPTLAGNYIPEGKEIVFHTENGCLGFGPTASTVEEEDFNLVNASGQFVTRQPGMSFFDHAESFAMIRGRHVDLCVLGGLQVSEKGDLANWAISEKGLGGIGGAMDLAFGAGRLIIAMTHTTKDGKPKILKECTFPLTAPCCVSKVISDLAVIEVAEQGLILKEMAPGWTFEEVQALTEAGLTPAADLREMEL